MSSDSRSRILIRTLNMLCHPPVLDRGYQPFCASTGPRLCSISYMNFGEFTFPEGGCIA